MANPLYISLSNAVNASKLLDRALAELEQHFTDGGELDRGKLLTVRSIKGDNGNNRYRLEQLQS